MIKSDRRTFIERISKGVLGVAAAQAAALVSACRHTQAAAAVPSIAPASAPTSTVVDVAGLSTEGTSVVAPIPGPDGAPILVTRTHGQLIALSLHCTHEGCPVNSTPVNGILRCPCHGSQFDLQGNVVHGPAMDPLGQYETTYDAARQRLTVNFIPSG